jgi:hypothetical protein
MGVAPVEEKTPQADGFGTAPAAALGFTIACLQGDNAMKVGQARD